MEKINVEEMLTVDAVDPTTTNWVSLIVFVPKKNVMQNFCVGYHRLHPRTVCDSHPTPRMDQYIDLFGEKKYVFDTRYQPQLLEN